MQQLSEPDHEKLSLS